MFESSSRRKRLNARGMSVVNVDWLIVPEPPLPRMPRAGCHVIGRKSTSHFWTTERNAIRSYWRSLVRSVEAEWRVNIPSECDSSSELRREYMVYNESSVKAVL